MDARTRVVALALLAPCLLLAACSSPTHPTSSSSAGHATTTTPAEPGTTLPVARTSGPLAIYASVPVATTPDELAAAEAPDGAVFVVQLASAVGDGPQIVWVVDGDTPAEVAEHLPGGADALAADGTNLYVSNDTGVTAYTRSTGNQSGQWALPPISTANTSDADLESMSASSGAVLVSVGQGNVVDVYRIDPQSAAAPVLVAQGSSAAFGPDGTVFYVRSDHHLVAQSASGVLTVGPALADVPNGLGGGVQYVNTVAGGVVWVSEPAGQGLDASFTTDDAKTLKPIANFSGTAVLQVAGTTAGNLALNSPGACPQPSASTVTTMCLARIAPDGTSTDLVPLGTALQALGPDPVALTASADNSQVLVERLK
jgi:hypothetical protein